VTAGRRTLDDEPIDPSGALARQHRRQRRRRDNGQKTRASQRRDVAVDYRRRIELDVEFVVDRGLFDAQRQ